MPYQMHHAQWYLGLREDRFYSFGEPFQPLDARDEDILHTSVLQLRDYRKPELRPFSIRSPHPQYLFQALQIDSECEVNRFIGDSALTLDLHLQSVEVQHWIYRIQRARLPGPNLIKDCVRDGRDQRRGD